MMLMDQVLAQALLLAGELDDRQTELLRILCTASASSLAARLREGLTPEDCKADFVAAASLYALAAFNCARDGNLEQITAGDLTVKRSADRADVASNCLRHQAELMITPYLKDRFVFKGV